MVFTTAWMASNYGYKTYVKWDATTTFDKLEVDGECFNSDVIHATTLASLNKEFVSVINSEHLLNII